MKVAIRTNDKILFTDSAIEVNLPGLYGKIGIRPHHSSMSVILTEGDIQVKLVNSDKIFSIKNGLAQVSNNTLDVLLTP
jgi:F0F1-type ATP synthase epsilon subunit